ncbi:molybdopterin-binding protein [Haloarcula halophila]|uniref:molybdopterin-binding protein n=1 Tax=Haloarcula TaxID=2237 RepID=UPI0023E46067|nr:molybdopterin-binding protein [Halomicroarcula sp. DFY41]
MAHSPEPDDDALTLETARREIGSYAVPVDRTDRIPLSVAVGRVLATDATAAEAVPEAGIDHESTVFERGHQVRPVDVGLLKAAGVNELLVYQRPQVGIVPTGDELVQRDAGRDERVETAGFTLSQYADRWGGKVTYRDPVADDRPALRMAVQRDLTRDVLVVTGTTPGDTLREVVADLGTVLTDELRLDPGHQTGLAIVEDRPVLLLPEEPVPAHVAAVQLLRPLLKSFAAAPLTAHPERRATLAEDVPVRGDAQSFVPVTVEDGTATPLAGTDLGTVTRADGWLTVPAGAEPPAAGETCRVENWDYLP